MQNPYNKIRKYSISPDAPRGLTRQATLIAIASLSLSLILLSSGFVLSTVRNGYDSLDAGNDIAAKNMALIEPVAFSETLREEAVDYVFARKAIPAYSFAEVAALDMSKPSGVTVEDLKLVTRHNLVGLEEAFYKAEQDYGVNALFVLGIASHESAYGTYCFRPNNLFGYGRKGYLSKAECIDVVARGLAHNYLRPGASLYSGNTIDSVNKRYAADPSWDKKVAKKVTGFYQTISERHNEQLNKLKCEDSRKTTSRV